MNALELTICVFVCLFCGFIIGILSNKSKCDFLSSLASLIVYAKKNNISDDKIHQTIKNQTDIMLQGYKDFEKDPEAAKKSIQSDQKNIKEMKALIKAANKTIKKANNFLSEWGVK